MPLLALGASAATLFPATTVQAHPSHPQIMQSALNEAKIPDDAVRPRAGAKIVMPLADNDSKRIVGQVIWFNLEKLGYFDKEENQIEVKWYDLAPDRLGRFIRALPNRKDAKALPMAAEVMINNKVDEKTIERLITYAERADDKVAALRQEMKGGGGKAPANGDDKDDGEKPAQGDGELAKDGQPDIDNPRAWPEMTTEQHAEAVKALATATDKVLEKMNHEMGSTETDRFLVYSDMNAKESKYWVSLLDKMYDELCGVFDLDKKQNIWKGKCLLLFFQKESDYLKYNMAAYGNNAQGSAGICYQYGVGDVHIAMYRQDKKLELAHVLVHEAAHGFLFRYKSSFHVPNWLNEGLAEFIAESLVDSGLCDRSSQQARAMVKQQQRLFDFLSARNIQGPH